ncbi:H(+)/Cl(-) exchange transporter ClcA [Yersinia pseudotuberculosis IP 32953]|uniref:H(+)/Cl(-) exchange transporter ClcA n=2 Tax=Yersinia pseudotuberculosis TaxID=633 RepID=CLCA_YERPB|nr:H(+)/Cl(-) exchange transporter ClcA [Yersinia pseudotuberculosis]B2K549.1 RecName: Full=H(+)/Cl(-) exchange transporter ClcA [Yersinia pseudotuberculosis PB1/+]CQD54289.1 chloride channel protein [Yersinia intermedia]AJJ01463.1 H(+)/Cl(-) exchange transporter ClcA [Yersinia pseudotuberculosis]AJJ54133.1 H(+)/Cl(-) exchange transporter ClcA [Yersinia pseudotuberculosis IP 32953]AJJ65544.1 H(+)/Cl(-) exchange transporter ClcA [Yersinia pseudotuberculosis PB1/+]AYX15605.1 H(+)/Cl(-) exchange
MTHSTQQLSPEGVAEGKRGRLIRELVNRDKTPLIILIMAAVVGVVTGLLGVAFDRGVDWVQQQRLLALANVADSALLVWPLAFIMSALLAMMGYFLVSRFAPEAGGSGIPEIEGAMEEMRPVRWWRVIPVKFIGGLGTLGAGMVLGREGPMVQMGGNSGRMIVDIFRLRSPEARHSLLATGAAAGLSAAFNAPLAGILFVIEEMRSQFRYSLVSIKAVFIGVITSTIVYRYFNGERAIIEVGKLSDAPLNTLWLYLLLGIIFGAVGVIFNALIFRTQDMFVRFHGGDWRKLVLIGGLLGGMCGLLALLHGNAVGGGFALIPIAAAGNFSIGMLLFIFIARVITTLLCFGSGAPGGIFAPMLALGTILGTAFGLSCAHFFPQYGIEAGTFAIAGMGALFAASVRAPLTGIVLVLEMTDNYQLILPMIVTCLGATLIAQFMGGKPLYSAILARTLAKQEQARATVIAQEPAVENTPQTGR